LLTHLLIPVSSATSGATPGGLRGSGASWFYQATEVRATHSVKNDGHASTRSNIVCKKSRTSIVSGLSAENRTSIHVVAKLALPALESLLLNCK
jgi:hypothetical protein